MPAVTATSTSHTLSGGDIAGIVIGTLLGCALLIALVFYLHRRYKHHSFTRVPNPTHHYISSQVPDLQSISSPLSIRHSRNPSASEPLIAPVSWPPIPLTSRVHSPSTPPSSDSASPGFRESQLSIGVVDQVTISHSTAPAILNIPPVRIPDPASSSPKSQQTLFIHRMLQSRARASDSVALAHHPSVDSVPSPVTADSATIHGHGERLIADAERTGLQDAEVAQKEDDDWDQRSTTESVYSQLSAPYDQLSLLSCPVSRQNTSVSIDRRKSSRRRPPTAELSPVTEAPDTPRGRCDTLSIGPNSSLDAQVSHGTVSRPMSSVFDGPLLASVNFGKDGAVSGTTLGSITSTNGWVSNSSGRASRYPSLAPSSIGLPSQSGSRSDDGTDWRHPPTGLSGLKTLQIGPLRNPHSPVEEHREQVDTSIAPGPVDWTSDRRAYLRQGTASSVPEVEHRAVVGAGIASIDVAF